MNRYARGVVGAAVLLLSLGASMPSPVAAQVQDPRPVLGGHRFIWNSFTESPFPRTHVRNNTGGGKITGLEFFPSFDLGGGIILPAVKGDLLFAELEFEYMQQVQPWLGVWARVGGIARVGTDAGSVLAQGVSAIFGYELGWLFRLYQNDSFVLSGTAALSDDGVTDVNVLRWVRGVIDDTGEPLVSSGPRLRTKGGLRAAWGLNENWGLQFKSELGYGEPTIPLVDSEWIWDHAASVSYDLAPTTSVPLGFVLSGASRAAPREGGNPEVRSRDVGLRTAFTGRDNFLVAFDTNWNSFQLPDGDDVSLIRAGLSLQLFF
jgi:hypothetical protein